MSRCHRGCIVVTMSLLRRIVILGNLVNLGILWSAGRAGNTRHVEVLPSQTTASLPARVGRGIRATLGRGGSGHRHLPPKYCPPSAGYPPPWRGLGTQTHKHTHKRDVCRCARCALCVRAKHTLCAEIIKNFNNTIGNC